MSKKVTPVFRVSFAHVFQPQMFEGSNEAKYSVVMLIPKNENIQELQQLAMQAIEAKWPDPAQRQQIMNSPTFKNPFRDGDVEKSDLEGYAGHWFITASGRHRPGVVDENLQPVMSEDQFYSGCYARAAVTAYAFDQRGNKGVAFGLQNIMKVRDGEPFASKSTPEEDFAAFAPQAGAPQGMPQQPNFGGAPQGTPQQPNFGGAPQGMPQQPNFGGAPQGGTPQGMPTAQPTNNFLG